MSATVRVAAATALAAAVGLTGAACSGETVNEAGAGTTTAAPVTLPAAPLGPPTREPLGIGFIADDPQDPEDVCFGPGPRGNTVASLVLGGQRREGDIYQCGSDRAHEDAQASLRFALDDLVLPDGALITGIAMGMGIDEQTPRQAGARVRFVVSAEGRTLCRLQATYGSPVVCRRKRLSIPATPGAEVTVRIDVIEARDGAIWAGIRNPVLLVRSPE